MLHNPTRPICNIGVFTIDNLYDKSHGDTPLI